MLCACQALEALQEKRSSGLLLAHWRAAPALISVLQPQICDKSRKHAFLGAKSKYKPPRYFWNDPTSVFYASQDSSAILWIVQVIHLIWIRSRGLHIKLFTLFPSEVRLHPGMTWCQQRRSRGIFAYNLKILGVISLFYGSIWFWLLSCTFNDVKISIICHGGGHGWLGRWRYSSEWWRYKINLGRTGLSTTHCILRSSDSKNPKKITKKRQKPRTTSFTTWNSFQMKWGAPPELVFRCTQAATWFLWIASRSIPQQHSKDMKLKLAPPLKFDRPTDHVR